jgi:hypothetical protein
MGTATVLKNGTYSEVSDGRLMQAVQAEPGAQAATDCARYL